MFGTAFGIDIPSSSEIDTTSYVIRPKYSKLIKIITIIVMLAYPIFFCCQKGGIAGFQDYRYSIITLTLFIKYLIG